MDGYVFRVSNVPYDYFVTGVEDPNPKSPKHIYVNRWIGG